MGTNSTRPKEMPTGEAAPDVPLITTSERQLERLLLSNFDSAVELDETLVLPDDAAATMGDALACAVVPEHQPTGPRGGPPLRLDRLQQIG